MSEADHVNPEPGIVPQDVVRSLDGMQFLQGLLGGRFPPAPIASLVGFTPIELEPGRAIFTATPDARHYNPLGSVHGGYISTLLDSCLACAVHSRLRAGQSYTTLELKVNFVRAVADPSGIGPWYGN
jgi:acyl-coenzyme A thioesterase PaaI-like protein